MYPTRSFQCLLFIINSEHPEDHGNGKRQVEMCDPGGHRLTYILEMRCSSTNDATECDKCRRLCLLFRTIPIMRDGERYFHCPGNNKGFCSDTIFLQLLQASILQHVNERMIPFGLHQNN